MAGIELYGEEEKKEVNDVLQTGMFFRYNFETSRNNNWKARDLEDEVKKITGAKYALALCNGTAAAATALAASGVGFGDEVIVPPFTFIATIEAVLAVGAIPVFAEIDETLCLSAAGIEEAMSRSKAKAVCLVHMCGGMANMKEIMPVIKKHNLILVEDAGQAMAASNNGTYTGLFGKAGSYSFDYFKIATAGEGGVMVTNDEQVYLTASYYADHGHNHVGNNRGMEQHPILGFNYRLSELHAAIGVAQVRKVPSLLEINRRNKAYLQQKLSSVEEISFVPLPDAQGDSATFLNILFTDTELAEATVADMKQNGVGGFNYWYENQYHFIRQWEHLKNLQSASKTHLHASPAFKQVNSFELPKSYEVIGRLLSFSISAKWTEKDMDGIVENLKASVAKVAGVSVTRK